MLEDKRIFVAGGFGYLGSWMARYLKEEGAWVKILARRILIILKNMKILIINKFYYLRGGTEKYFFEVGKLLENKGHIVYPFSMEHIVKTNHLNILNTLSQILTFKVTEAI